MSTTAGIFLAFAIGSIVLFSTIFLVISLNMRNRWDQLDSPRQSPDQPDA